MRSAVRAIGRFVVSADQSPFSNSKAQILRVLVAGEVREHLYGLRTHTFVALGLPPERAWIIGCDHVVVLRVSYPVAPLSMGRSACSKLRIANQRKGETSGYRTEDNPQPCVDSSKNVNEARDAFLHSESTRAQIAKKSAVLQGIHA